MNFSLIKNSDTRIRQKDYLLNTVEYGDNLFVEDTFINIWLKYYGRERKLESFEGLKPLSFVNLRLLKICINAGANKTYGLSYNINDTKFNNPNKIILIKDIHAYFNKNDTLNSSVGKRTLKRYPGYLVDLSDFENIEQFLKTRFSKNRIRKLRTSKKRLELCYDIKYRYFENIISKEEHESIFLNFKHLLIKRYKEKKIKNIFLEDKHWLFQSELSYKLINEGKASIFVMYANAVPINICLNYLNRKTVILGMTVFDTDFERFNIGHLSFNKQLEYYYESGHKIIDFSQSTYDYKSKICNKKYHFEYHVLYNNKSIKHTFLSFFVWLFYVIVTIKYNLSKYYSSGVSIIIKRFLKPKNSKFSFKFFDIEESEISLNQLQVLTFESIPEKLKKPINYFLYKHSTKNCDIKFFRFLNNQNAFLLVANSKIEKVVINLN